MARKFEEIRREIREPIIQTLQVFQLECKSIPMPLSDWSSFYGLLLEIVIQCHLSEQI